MPSWREWSVGKETCQTMGSRQEQRGEGGNACQRSSFLEQTCGLWWSLIGSNRAIRSRNDCNREIPERRVHFFVDLIDILALFCTLSDS